MEKVLSKEEIDALFSAMSSEEGGVEVRSERNPAAHQRALSGYHPMDMMPQEQVLYDEYGRQRNSREQKAERHDAKELYELIRTISVPVDGEILNSKITLDDLLKISEGDIIELDERIGDSVYLCVGGIALFEGRIIQRRGKRAFEISERFVGQRSPG